MNLKTELLPHQVPAAAKMMPTRVGALFMDMGTGKTRTAIEVVCRRWHKISNVVWFCPVSLKETIRKEVLKHTDTPVERIHVFDDRTRIKTLPAVPWYIVGIESMSASARVILAVNHLVDERTFAIVDESEFIKGHRSARTNWITDICARARYRMILSGMPISQGVVDLFAQCRFLSPKILGYTSFYSFSRNHLEYSDIYPGMIVRAHNEEYLAAKLKPYVYQVTSEESLDLPAQLYETRYFEMTWEQRGWYEDVKKEVLEEIVEWDSYAIFQLFTHLQQIVCGFLNKHDLVFGHHWRIDCLKNTIERIGAGRKIIIFCKYEHDIHAITEALGEENVACFYGRLNVKKRNQSVDAFRNGKRFFLATESCGGYGLTLNEADRTIFYNNTFKLAQRMQAEKRCHRIGQDRPVLYVDIVCSNSIDERIMNSLYAKGSVVDDFKAEVDRVKGDKAVMKELIKAL